MEKLTRNERDAIFTEMIPATQRKATEFAELNRRRARGLLCLYYRRGVIIDALINGVATYGDRAVDQLAKWTGESTDSLYKSARVAKIFGDEQHILELAERTMTDGNHITCSHLILLTAVRSATLRDELLEQTYQESLSTRALYLAIAARDPSAHVGPRRGRRPSRPSSPLGAAQQMSQAAKSFCIRLAIWDAVMIDGLVDLPPDRVDAVLITKYKAVLSTMMALRERIAKLRLKIHDVLAHLHEKYEARTAPEPVASADCETVV